MQTRSNQIYKLTKRPVGNLSTQDLTLENQPIPDLQAGEILVEQTYLSVDPTNRIWMSDMDQYMPPVGIGDVMRGLGVGRVVESKSERFQKGDRVAGLLNWQSHPVVHETAVEKIEAPESIPDSVFLGPLGMTGCTAYFGLLDIGKPKTGETLVVSAAAGAVGSIVGQIAKIKGLNVVGIAGSDEKCGWLTGELGFDGSINYKTDDLSAKLKELCPKGIDIYFENVGGKILDAILPQMNLYGRIPLCGLISSYNSTTPVPGPYQFSQVLMKRLTIQGFIILDYQQRMAEAQTQLAEWLSEGKIKYKESIVEGFQNAPKALQGLFDGTNIGKQLVKVH